MDLEGVAEVCLSMLYSTIGDAKQLKSGRQAAAFIGVTETTQLEWKNSDHRYN